MIARSWSVATFVAVAILAAGAAQVKAVQPTEYLVTQQQGSPPRPPVPKVQRALWSPRASVACPYKRVCAQWGPKAPGDLSGPCLRYVEQRVCPQF